MFRSIFTTCIMAAAVAVMTMSANAQSFVEGFDAPDLGASTTIGNTVGGDMVALSSGTWVAVNASTPVGTTGWFNNTTVFAPHSGAAHLNSNFNNTTGANNINNFFMSPVLTFNNGDTISFFTRTVDAPAFPDRLNLLLSTNGASIATGDFSTNLVTVNGGLTTAGYPNVYTQFTGTVSGLAGPTSGRFAFNYNPTNAGPAGVNSDFIGIDTVAYTSTAVIPEPASAMVLLGMCVAGGLTRRRVR